MYRLLNKFNRVAGAWLTRDLNANSVFKRCHVKSIVFDQRFGAGATGVNKILASRGLIVMITPSQFFKLAGAGTINENYKNDAFYGEQLEAGKSIASPYLCMDFSGSMPRVVGHEGRHRMGAILNRYGDIPVPVGIYVGSKTTLDQISHHHLRRLGGPVLAENGWPTSPTGIETIYKHGEKFSVTQLIRDYHEKYIALNR